MLIPIIPLHLALTLHLHVDVCPYFWLFDLQCSLHEVNHFQHYTHHYVKCLSLYIVNGTVCRLRSMYLVHALTIIGLVTVGMMSLKIEIEHRT